MRECGQTIEQMELEFTSIIVVHVMKVSGKTIFSMASVLKFGLIIQNIKDSMSKGVKMVLVLIIGQMEVTMKGSGH
jgi:FtsZ-interacting cell division protein ZipA